MQPDLEPYDQQEATSNREHPGAQAVLLNWMDVNRKNDRPSLQRLRALFSSIGKWGRGTRLPEIRLPRLQSWFMRTGLVVGIALVLFLLFRPDPATNTLLEESNPAFDDVIFHPIVEEKATGPETSGSGEKVSSGEQLPNQRVSPEPQSSQTNRESSSSIQTAEFTTENSSSETRGAWLTGTIESEEKTVPVSLPEEDQIERRVEFGRYDRN